MKFSEHWLREWVNPPISREELIQRLTMAGIEIGAVIPAAPDFSKVVIGEILTIKPHPGNKAIEAADLSLCEINIGEQSRLNIVTSAKNLHLAQKIPVALPGAILPSGVTVQVQMINGVASQGVLCSAQELGLEEHSTSILTLPKEAPVGEDIRDYLYLNDFIIELDLTPNQGDCLSLMGIAREVAALTHHKLSTWHVYSNPTTIDERVTVQLDAAKECPRYVGRVINDIDNTVITPLWLQERLRRSGIRSTNFLVDITQYVMLECGQPLHAFDTKSISGTVQVRKALLGETITLLDQKIIDLDPADVVIADTQKPLALAGIMGSDDSKVTLSTNSLFLESAFFTPETIAMTARRHTLATEAAYRFERGVDPELAVTAIERATQLILQYAGGKAGSLTEVTSHYLPKNKVLNLRKARISAILGFCLADELVLNILHSLGIAVESADKALMKEVWQIVVPSYRFDINIEEDLIEEIARVHGYDHIPVTLPTACLSASTRSSSTLSVQRLRTALIDRGYHEVITYSFISPELQQLVDPQQSALSLLNPISADLAVMRTSLWPGLITILQYNQNRQINRLRLFEIGPRFLYCENTTNQVKQETVIAGIICGTQEPEQWGYKSIEIDFYSVKNDLEALFYLTKRDKNLTFKQCEHPALHPGQGSKIILHDKEVGYLGALHPTLLKKLSLQGPIYLFELDINFLTVMDTPCYKPFSRFPAIRRDIALEIDSNLTAQEILSAVYQQGNQLLKNIEVFDVYQGENIAPGKKSFALALMLQDNQRTLVESEVNALVNKIIKFLEQQFDARLR